MHPRQRQIKWPLGSRADVPRVELDIDTTVPPERVRGALLDFTERRPDIWPGLERSLFEVYSVGETTAEVKEGSKAPGMTIWAKEHYDWTDPDTIRWTAVESNFCAPGSYVEVTLHPRDGGTRIHVEWERTGTTFLGKLLIRLIKLTNGKPIAASVKKALANLERQ
jgi:hypothetical protein